MSRTHRKIISTFLTTALLSSFGQMQAHAFVAPDVPHADSLVLSVKQAKCSAGTVEDYEGTDMSGVTAKCQSIFNACVNEKLPCKARLQKCKQFDKMDRDGSCYKNHR